MDYGPPKEFTPLARGKRGVGWHPHRGFETVTLAWEGAVAHRDNAGHAGVIGPGDAQWMTAGGGIFHEEYHEEEFSRRGGRMHMMQLWVNLPRKDKTAPPALPADHRGADPARRARRRRGAVRVIAGAYGARAGRPARSRRSPCSTCSLPRAGGCPSTLPRELQRAGRRRRGARHGGRRDGGAGELSCSRNDGERLELTADGGQPRHLLAGEPIDEPIVQYGPFVMNTFDEIARR